jgi:hypothetical protein
LFEKEDAITALWKNFWGQPEKLEAIHRGEDIKFNYSPLESAGQRLYFFKQYAYLRDRIDAFRADDTSEKWKRCVVVTGTPGIGKAFYLLFPSD